jgi:Ca2+-transporting ATPase
VVFIWLKLKTIVKQTKTVETLGSATVICTDKTGTITENKMSLAKLFALNTNKISTATDALNDDEKKLVTISMWASEPIPFDAMEVALHNAYKEIALQNDERYKYKLIHEYPLSGVPPMMTHIFENKAGNRIIAAKGATEALTNICNLSTENKKNIEDAITAFAIDGYRVLGVAEAKFDGNNFPEIQQEFQFTFIGLVGFYDPPKKNIKSVLQSFYNAGIAVKIITGDNAATTTAIAKQIEFKGYEKSITGINSINYYKSKCAKNYHL